MSTKSKAVTTDGDDDDDDDDDGLPLHCNYNNHNSSTLQRRRLQPPPPPPRKQFYRLITEKKKVEEEEDNNNNKKDVDMVVLRTIQLDRNRNGSSSTTGSSSSSNISCCCNISKDDLEMCQSSQWHQERKQKRNRHKNMNPSQSIRSHTKPKLSFLYLIAQIALSLTFLGLIIGAILLHHNNDQQLQQQQQLSLLQPLSISPQLHTVQDKLQITTLRTQLHPQQQKDNVITTTSTTILTPNSLPIWNLTSYAMNYDAYAIADPLWYTKKHPIPTMDRASTLETINRTTTNYNNNKLFWQAAAGLRERFAEIYGGENAARALLERGLTIFGTKSTISYPTNLQTTACRIRQAKLENRSFNFAFGGYSVTAGRGNWFQQSFPLVMEQQLHTIFQLYNVPLKVRNAAIGGCPSFPYGWCMSNFWGQDADVVSWDFSMNEAGGDPIGLEAYLRHVLHMPNRPKLIILDPHIATDRYHLLQHYHNLTTTASHPYKSLLTMLDMVIVHTDSVVVQPFLTLPEQHRPMGFQNWRLFGAPRTAPGQSLHHPAVKEHELMAWLLTMHFLAALQLLMKVENNNNNNNNTMDQKDPLQCQSLGLSTKVPNHEILLPQPMYQDALQGTKHWLSILFGEPIIPQKQNTSELYWRMKSVHCHTSFDPIVSRKLSDLVISGSVGEDMDIMLPKSKMFYNFNWVMDLSDQEKKAKRNLNRFGGLGFVDSKKAYYGIYASGPLQLFLPYYYNHHHHDMNDSDSSTYRKQNRTIPMVGDRASDYFHAVVLCEVNETRGPTACNNHQDVSYTFGFENEITLERTQLDILGTLYLGKKLCTHLLVPDTVQLTSRDAILAKTNGRSSSGGSSNTSGQHPPLVSRRERHPQQDEVGLLVTITIQNHHIVKREDSCSISHVVWEQK